MAAQTDSRLNLTQSHNFRSQQGRRVQGGRVFPSSLHQPPTHHPSRHHTPILTIASSPPSGPRLVQRTQGPFVGDVIPPASVHHDPRTKHQKTPTTASTSWSVFRNLPKTSAGSFAAANAKHSSAVAAVQIATGGEPRPTTMMPQPRQGPPTCIPITLRGANSTPPKPSSKSTGHRLVRNTDFMRTSAVRCRVNFTLTRLVRRMTASERHKIGITAMGNTSCQDDAHTPSRMTTAAVTMANAKLNSPLELPRRKSSQPFSSARAFMEYGGSLNVMNDMHSFRSW